MRGPEISEQILDKVEGVSFRTTIAGVAGAVVSGPGLAISNWVSPEVMQKAQAGEINPWFAALLVSIIAAGSGIITHLGTEKLRERKTK